MENDDEACVKFKPSEYIIIYHSRLQNEFLKNSSKLDAICLLQMRARSWQIPKVEIDYNKGIIIYGCN